MFDSKLFDNQILILSRIRKVKKGRKEEREEESFLVDLKRGQSVSGIRDKYLQLHLEKNPSSVK